MRCVQNNYDIICMQFLESFFTLRDEHSHQDQCDELDGDSSGEVSKEYGINRNSILNELSFFHVCSGALLPDIMHDVLEGALQYEVKLMLKEMVCTEGYFSLNFLNSRIETIELGYNEIKDHPTPISDTVFNSEGTSLKQAGICEPYICIRNNIKQSLS